MKIIAGLGNPGKRYDNTRHNIGFAILDYLAFHLGIRIEERKHRALLGKGILEGEKIILLKPQTYMNLSGESIRAALDYYKLKISDLIIIFDDISLEPGDIRIRSKGSAGGHNGVKSIISHLSSQDFARIKVGVGEKPKNYDLTDYVLGHFSAGEQKLLEQATLDSIEALKLMIKGDIEQAMNQFNRKKK